jgi:hypothetical protein
MSSALENCWSSDAGPSTDLIDKLTNCLLQPMGVVIGASAVASHARTEQLLVDEGPVVVPQVRGQVQVTGMGAA